MTAQETRLEADGFVPFFRSYTRTWIHAVATAGLTAFGTLTIVHNWFAALALAVYVVPPIALYLRYRSRDQRATQPADSEADSSADAESAVGEEPRERRGWHTVDVPTDATLRDVVVGTNGVYAVGDGGIVLAATDDSRDATDRNGDSGDDWTVVLEDGPAAGGNDLRGVDTTAAGEAVWIAGDSGSLGRIDAATGRHTDYTAPEDVTDNWLGVAVGGERDTETILLITGSGAVLRGRYRDDGLEWTGPDKPGSGSSLSGVALAGDVGYCCDTNDGVFETTDGGDSFDRIGLEGADGTLTDVATTGQGDCPVSADDGVVHRYDGTQWTPDRVLDGVLSGIARRDERTAVCADDGHVYERDGPTAAWDRSDPDVSTPLLSVSIGSNRTVAVGESGTVLERG
ncbi:hypothetical protein RBH26_11015 [Natronolimnohabitans sp. A-GB9]|uniref:hypothetical protein n=1 Tax=Natronolimnohabitans sp. A-GB9 TaxID=3069757 RepID=UPI0027B23488|nr:hypothetical protein [Natronolimnohabitans sp. A-GB9]MDQ2051010.1 hypothetical protein [Natronolimnohabitans sp. A-GB9]